MFQKLRLHLNALLRVPVRVARIETRLRGFPDTGRIPLGAFRTGEYEAVTRLATGEFLYVDSRDVSVAIPLIMNGEYEPELSALFRRLLKPGMVMLDVGANFGYFGIMAAYQQQCRVHFLEANPNLIPLLGKSLLVNGVHGHCRIKHCAVSDASGGRITLYVPDNVWGGASVAHVPAFPNQSNAAFEAEVWTLDDYAAQEGLERVDVVKVDVESHEAHAYAGMRQLVRRNPQLKLLMEYTFGAYPSNFLEALRADFRSVRVLSHSNELQTFTDEADLRTRVPQTHTIASLLLENDAPLA